MDYRIFPPDKLVDVSVSLPYSKSFINRLLIISELAGSNLILNENKLCDDVKALKAGLSSTDNNAKINIGAAGTAMRFLTAYYASRPGTDVIIDGSTRMRERPIGVLIEALQSIGADVEYLSHKGFPPLKIKGKKLIGGKITINAGISSQYVSALLMIAPYTEQGIRLTLTSNAVSTPYIHMTITLMSHFGITPEIEGHTIYVPAGQYRPIPIEYELDWSAASYWAEIVALSGGMVRLPKLTYRSIQGDKETANLFSPLGVDCKAVPGYDGIVMEANPEIYTRINYNLEKNPDVVQTLAVTCALLSIPFRFTGLSTLRIKETDRLEALRIELKKLGCQIDVIGDDAIEWEGLRIPVSEPPIIETYKDHRMAMAFAPAAFILPGIVIRDIDVVNKSYPEFWNQLKQAGFQIVEASCTGNTTINS